LPVSKVETKQHRADYLRSFAENELPAASAPRGESRSVTVGEELPPRPKQKRPIAPSKKRPVLIPRTCVLTIPDSKPNDIYHELRRPKLEDFPYAVGVLFRVFLELSIDRYIIARRLLNKAELDVQKLRVKLLR